MSRYYLDCWTFFIKYLSHTVVVGQWTMGRREMLAELCLKLVGKNLLEIIPKTRSRWELRFI